MLYVAQGKREEKRQMRIDELLDSKMSQGKLPFFRGLRQSKTPTGILNQFPSVAHVAVGGQRGQF